MDRWNMTCIHINIYVCIVLFIHKKGDPTIFNNMDEHINMEDIYAWWNKTEKQIFYDVSYMWNLNKKVEPTEPEPGGCWKGWKNGQVLVKMYKILLYK